MARSAREPEQLPLDFADSVGQRTRRAQFQQQLLPLAPFVDLDVHLASASEAFIDIGGQSPEAAALWIYQLLGSVRHIRRRRVGVPPRSLDRLLYVRPPARVTLDAPATAVGRAIWAQKLGINPLVVRRQRGRLVASSERWPKGLAVSDVPWTAIAAVERLGLPLSVEPDARSLMVSQMSQQQQILAVGGLAGSAVALDTSRPDLLEAMQLPGLTYAGQPGSGKYRIPLLLAECLLAEPTVGISAEVRAAIRRANKHPRPLATAGDFPWTLYQFQARDAGRAKRILETAGGVLLAGDMGSGKTTISLALANDLGLWPLLVVAPLAAFSTWDRQLGELGKRTVIATGPMTATWQQLQDAEYDAVVISYDRLHAFVELLEHLEFRAIVADEVQRIRTPGSRRSRALRSLSGTVPYRIGLSGTPMQNRLTDLLPLGAFLVPSEWRPRSERDLSDLYPGDDPIDAVRVHLGSLMVRRRMEDTGVALPGKQTHRVLVDLTPEQLRALDELRNETAEEQHAGAIGNQQRMHVFSRLQRMRQIISCPAMAEVPGPSPKISAAIDLVEEYVDRDRKGIIFCVYRQTWTEIRKALKKAGIAATGVRGSSSVAERLQAERQFHQDPATKVFVGTLAACAESLTLSPTATFAVFVDYSYSPSEISQAQARAYRLNTTDPVEIIHLHARAHDGTVDDRMVELLSIKQELFARVVDNDDTWRDPAQLHYSLDDLVYLVTGEHGSANNPQDEAAVAELDLVAIERTEG